MRSILFLLLLSASTANAFCTYCENIETGEKEHHCLDDRFKDPCKKGWKPAYAGPGWGDK